MTTVITKLDHLQKNFGKFVALKDASLTLAPGQVLGFSGPNGADKSTITRVILGLLKKSSGSATVFGKDVWRDNATIHPRIAYVPGDVYLWPNLSGGGIIDLLLCLNGRQHNQKTDELIEAFELDPKKKARTCLKGNRQKVALIAAPLQDADSYIPDEPTSGLDPLSEQTFQREALKLRRAGKSVLLSSHISPEVERTCDSIVIIHDGSVVENGNLDQLRHLSRVKIEVTTAAPVTVLAKQAGVHNLTYRDPEHTKAVFTADWNTPGTIITTLAANTVVDMQLTPPVLEDLFPRYYGKQGETHAAQ